MAKLEENLRALTGVNEKLQEDNTRLRRERDFYRNEASKLNKELKQNEANKTPTLHQSNFTNPNDSSVLYRYRDEN